MSALVLYALLKDRLGPVNAEALKASLETAFAGRPGFSATWELKPFFKTRTIKLRWGEWSADVHYNDGADVIQDSQEIARRLGDSAPPGVAGVSRNIYVVFADDPERLHTDHAIDLMQFLEGIEGAMVFDPQQNKLIHR